MDNIQRLRKNQFFITHKHSPTRLRDADVRTFRRQGVFFFPFPTRLCPELEESILSTAARLPMNPFNPQTPHIHTGSGAMHAKHKQWLWGALKECTSAFFLPFPQALTPPHPFIHPFFLARGLAEGQTDT